MMMVAGTQRGLRGSGVALVARQLEEYAHLWVP